MERLVTRIGNEPAVPTEFDMDFAFDLDKKTFDKLQRIFNRLCDLTDILGDDYDLDRLKELVQADKEGRCVLLPCKVGDKLYKISENGVKEVVVQSIVFMLSHTVNHLTVHVANERGAMTEIETKDFGKIVFLTSEEAEAALEKMKEGDK